MDVPSASKLSTDAARFRPGRAFSLFTGVLLGALLLTLLFGLMHVSSEPRILGRYSPRYFALLLGLATSAGMLAWLLVAPRPASVRWAGNVYALLVSTTLTVAVAEVGLRLANPWGIELFSLLPYHMQGMVDHPRLGYVHPQSTSYRLGSNRVFLNSHGFRDDEMPLEKPPGERRILVLGDSVTFGWGVDQGEDFPARLEALLRQLQGGAWQVINSGVNGYNSQQEAEFFVTKGIRFQPDIVLLVFVANDVDPIFDPNETTWRRYPSWPSSLPELLDRARSVSYLYQTTKLFGRMRESNPPDTDTPRTSLADHPGWPGSLEALTAISRLCAQERIQFLVAFESGSDTRLTASLAQAGIESITLDPAWSRVTPGRHRVSRVDSHPSAEAHDQIARLLLEEMRKRRWLEPRSSQ